MKKLPVLLTLVLSLIACNLNSSTLTPESKSVLQTDSISTKGHFSQQSVFDQNLVSLVSYPNSQPGLSNSSTFAQLSLIPNIETIGVVVSGTDLPIKADLQYHRADETTWHTGHPLMRIDDGRLVGSLFGLSAATSYSIKVLDGATEINGSITTQPSELQFTPSVVLHVNDDAPAGGDGSAAAPFRTIQEGVNRAGPGTQVLVADGIYREAVTFPSSGSAGNWIQVKAEGNGAILDSSKSLPSEVWEQSKPHVWYTKVNWGIKYLGRNQQRFYQYDTLHGVMEGVGHNNVSMSEGWYYDPTTSRLYVRIQQDPIDYSWQLPQFNGAFSVDGRDWIWIEGFEMRFYGTEFGCGACLNNASHIVVRKNKIHNLQNGVFVSWTGGEDRGNDTRIEYNEFYDPPLNEWPWAAVKGTAMEATAIVLRGHIGTIVRENHIHNYFNGIYTSSSAALDNPGVAFDVDAYNNKIDHIADDALEPEGTCVNHRFRNNTIDTMLVGISLGPVTMGPVWVVRSTFSNFTGRSIKWDKNSDGWVFIYHNTSWTNQANLNLMEMISPVHNSVIKNNIFQGNGYAIEEHQTGSTGHDWNYDNWNTTRGTYHFKWENVDYTTIEKLCAKTGLECKGFEDLPGLSNPGGGDFTLLPTSPNIDRGIGIPGINDQFSGTAPDIGAFELVTDSPPAVLSIARTDLNPTGAANVNFTVTFSEPVTGVDVLAPFNDFGLIADSGITNASIISVTPVSGTTYTVGVNTGSGNGTIGLDLVDDDSILDAANNPLGGAGAGNGNFNGGESYAVEKSLPRVSGILLIDPNFTDAGTVHFTVSFSKEVSGVDAGDLSLVTTGGISGAAIGEVSGSGSTYTVTVATGSGDGTVRLDVMDNDSIMDATGNPLGGVGTGNGNFITGGVYTIDKTPPKIVASLRADPNPTAADTVRFIVTFSEAVSGVDPNDFRLITTDSLSGVSITGLSGSGNIYTITTATGNGVGTFRLDLTDDDSITDSLGHPLGGVGVGNGSFTSGEAYTVNKPPVTILSEVFNSIGTYDGWVLESAEESNKGGSKNSNAITFNLGDDDKDRQYRAILHFSTNTLPDKAVITQVILMIKKQDVVGTDPFTTHQYISIDIRKGVFGSIGPFSIGALQVSDFQAPASRNAVGMMQNNPVGGWYWAVLDNAAMPYVNLVGPTQFCLSFRLGDNDDQGNDYIKFVSGNYGEIGDRPQLIVKYYVPK